MRQPLAIDRISAVTLRTRDMGQAVHFYQSLGFAVEFGGADADFTTLLAGSSALNLRLHSAVGPPSNWDRVIFHVSDVDAFYETAVAEGLSPEFPPRDAPWGERYFHLRDPDGHRLSFAKPLS